MTDHEILRVEILRVSAVTLRAMRYRVLRMTVSVLFHADHCPKVKTVRFTVTFPNTHLRAALASVAQVLGAAVGVRVPAD